ncbi:MAG: lysylphosphatidylglycerol synthase transmembrane domain-containing protein [Miltoncostaeaceae bacterium]
MGPSADATESAPPTRRAGRLRDLGLVGATLLGLVALWFAMRGVDFGELRQVLADAAVPELALGIAAILITYPMLGLRWAVVAGKASGPPAGMVRWTLVGAAVNNIFPGRLGEAARALGLRRMTGGSALGALGTVVVDRLADVLLLVMLLAVTAPFIPGADWVRWVLGAGAGVAVLAVIVLAAVIVWVRRTRREEGRLRAMVLRFARGLDCVDSPLTGLRIALWTVALWGIWLVGAWLVADALGVRLSPVETMFLAAAIGVGSAVPSAPGFVGTYHWVAAASLALYGVAPASAAAFALVLHAAWFLPTTLVGAVLMARLGVDWRSLRRSAVSMPAESVR